MPPIMTGGRPTTWEAGDFPSEMPLEPVTRIAPPGRWVFPNLVEVWQYRELLYFLTWKEIKIRYQQTVLGVAWAVIQPVFTMLIFTIFFGSFAKIPSDGLPYPVFVFAGLVPWTFFANVVTNSSNSLVGSANLITKVYFPRLLIPASAVCAGLVDLAIACSVLGIMMVIYEVPLSTRLVLVPLLVLMLGILALAIGLWGSALNVKYRDVRYALPFFVQLWMFATPVIYPASIVPRRWEWIMALNPLTGIIEGFRAAIFGRPVDTSGLLISGVVTILVLWLGLDTFARTEREFADVI